MTASIDSSLRFVLPEDAPYLKNLAALWAVDPKLARQIEATNGDSTIAYKIETARSGIATINAQMPDGRKIYLHSRYHPVDEAAKLIEPLNTKDVVAFFVHGFGLGYHLQELFDHTC